MSYRVQYEIKYSIIHNVSLLRLGLPYRYQQVLKYTLWAIKMVSQSGHAVRVFSLGSLNFV